MRRSLTLVSATWLFVSMIPFPCQLLAQGKGATSPQVGAVYHTCFRHPSRHFQTKSGQDALTLHFKNPKQVDGQSVAWHTSQLDQMMTASLDFIAFAWPMNDATDQKEALQSLKALIEARTAITKAGGAPPTIALFLETSPHADLDRRADRLDLREETGRDQLISQIMGAFAVITKDHRATIDGFLPIFAGPANGTPHSKDIFSHLLFFLKMKLKASPYFVV